VQLDRKSTEHLTLIELKESSVGPQQGDKVHQISQKSPVTASFEQFQIVKRNAQLSFDVLKGEPSAFSLLP
jgi:hypothetical protein